jgi:hypothetical protein
LFPLQIFEFDPGKSDARPKVLTALTSTRGMPAGTHNNFVSEAMGGKKKT